MRSRVIGFRIVLATALLTCAACAGPAVQQAVGTGSDATPVVVRTSEAAVTVENHAGRPLLNVRLAVDAAGTAAPFVRVIPSIEAGQTMTLPLAEFRTEEDVALDPLTAAPRQVMMTARDTLTKSYELTVAWR